MDIVDGENTVCEAETLFPREVEPEWTICLSRTVLYKRIRSHSQGNCILQHFLRMMHAVHSQKPGMSMITDVSDIHHLRTQKSSRSVGPRHGDGKTERTRQKIH